MRDLSRLINPNSIAVFGGLWAENIISQLQKSGYEGEIWPIHPTRSEIGGVECFIKLDDLPSAPDAAFIGVNRQLSVDIIKDLSEMGAGGAICFASGFGEAGNFDLQEALINAAGEMPFLGPNCYGLLNYLDNVTQWPDQHGGVRVETGVGILAQSSNIAINMTMQKRGLPIGQVITIGNQAQTGLAELLEAQIADPRITAIGLYLEGFGDIRAFERAALKARAAGKPIIAIKTGASEKSQMSAMSHTASLAGSAAASSAFLKRLGITEVKSIAVFLETLKILHIEGALKGTSICSVSCSGGEASLMADLSEDLDLEYPDFPQENLKVLSKVLGPDVTLANPLDYHTYIWGDVPKMTACFTAVMQSGFDLNVFVLDVPRDDRCDPRSFECAIEAIIRAKKSTDAPVAVLSLLPENINENVNAQFQANGVIVMNGMDTGLAAIEAAYFSGRNISAAIPEKEVWLSGDPNNLDTVILSEAKAKAALSEFGLKIPQNVSCETLDDLQEEAKALSFPLALKALGHVHKTEAGGVILNIQNQDALKAACNQIAHGTQGYLLEEMALKPVAELILGVTRDSTGLLILTIGAGGVLTELLNDSVSFVLPCSRHDVEIALNKLKLSAVLNGYRGQPAADMPAILDAVNAIMRYAETYKDTLLELDVNPLMAGATDAVAVDALIRLKVN